MIAYEVLVQTIADWKAGVRPTAPIPQVESAGAPENVEELSSGMVDLEEQGIAADYSEADYASEDASGEVTDGSTAPAGEDYEAGYGEAGGEHQGYDQGAYEQGAYEQGAYEQGTYEQGGYETEHEPAPTETYDDEQ